MKKSQLNKIIKEEVDKVLNEEKSTGWIDDSYGEIKMTLHTKGNDKNRGLVILQKEDKGIKQIVITERNLSILKDLLK